MKTTFKDEATVDAEPIELCDFRIVVDSREQAPFHFLGLKTDAGRTLSVPLASSIALSAGDYSIEGFESRVAIERKSVPDFFGSIGRERERFEREMERLAMLDFAAVVIEGDWQQLLIDRPSSTQVSGKVASRTIASWSIRYGVHFYPCLNRRHAELWTFSLLSMWWRQQERSRKAAEAVAEVVAEAVVSGVSVVAR